MSARSAAAIVTDGPTLLLSRQRVTQQIISSLRREITSGRLDPGDRLPSERDLAQQYGVSQPTIREALRALDTIGLVDVRHGSGAYVADRTAQLVAHSLLMLLQMQGVGIIDVLELRAELSRYSARKAATRATREDLGHMEKALEAIDAARTEGDRSEAARAIVRFQIAVSEAAHDPLLAGIEGFLIRLLMEFQLHAYASRDGRFWRQWTAGADRFRKEVYRCLLAREVDAVVDAMHAYLSQQRKQFKSHVELSTLELTDPDLMGLLSPMSPSATARHVRVLPRAPRGARSHGARTTRTRSRKRTDL